MEREREKHGEIENTKRQEKRYRRETQKRAERDRVKTNVRKTLEVFIIVVRIVATVNAFLVSDYKGELKTTKSDSRLTKKILGRQ